MTRACETCGGEGTVIEFRRFAGEYQAGEPVEVPCPDCDGEDENPAPRQKFVPSDEYLAWCAKVDADKKELIALRDADSMMGDPAKHLEPNRKVA